MKNALLWTLFLCSGLGLAVMSYNQPASADGTERRYTVNFLDGVLKKGKTGEPLGEKEVRITVTPDVPTPDEARDGVKPKIKITLDVWGDGRDPRSVTLEGEGFSREDIYNAVRNESWYKNRTNEGLASTVLFIRGSRWGRGGPDEKRIRDFIDSEFDEYDRQIVRMRENVESEFDTAQKQEKFDLGNLKCCPQSRKSAPKVNGTNYCAGGNANFFHTEINTINIRHNTGNDPVDFENQSVPALSGASLTSPSDLECSSKKDKKRCFATDLRCWYADSSRVNGNTVNFRIPVQISAATFTVDKDEKCDEKVTDGIRENTVLKKLEKDNKSNDGVVRTLQDLNRDQERIKIRSTVGE